MVQCHDITYAYEIVRPTSSQRTPQPLFLPLPKVQSSGGQKPHLHRISFAFGTIHDSDENPYL
jgi:hypothetical protein